MNAPKLTNEVQTYTKLMAPVNLLESVPPNVSSPLTISGLA